MQLRCCLVSKFIDSDTCCDVRPAARLPPHEVCESSQPREQWGCAKRPAVASVGRLDECLNGSTCTERGELKHRASTNRTESTISRAWVRVLREPRRRTHDRSVQQHSQLSLIGRLLSPALRAPADTSVASAIDRLVNKRATLVVAIVTAQTCECYYWSTYN